MEPRAAATVIVARPSGEGVEVVVLRRSERATFLPGFLVFPGGAIEDQDDAEAVRLFGDAGEAPRACAVRELYEETGFLLTASGIELRADRPPLPALTFRAPSTEGLPEVSRWVAPEALEVRFDARFFATAAPAGIDPVADGLEIERAWWARPADVLAEGQASLMWPTLVMMEALARCAGVDDVLSMRMDQVPRPR
jgi:recombination protein RecT